MIPVMDEATRQLVFADRSRTQQVRNASGGTTHLRWSGNIAPDVEIQIKERLTVLDGIRTIKSRKPAKVNEARAKLALEHRGILALALPDADDAVVRSRTWVTRIYYVSMGGEVLCFETAKMGAGPAQTLCSAHQGRQGLAPEQPAAPATAKRGAKRTAPVYIEIGANGSDALDAECFDVKADAKGGIHFRPLKHGARFITLPSQSSEPVQTTCEVDVLDEAA